MKKLLVLVVALAAAALAWIVLAPSSDASAAGNCSGFHSDTTFTSVQVPKNGFCVISNSTVTGAVTVAAGGDFETCDDVIDGSITTNQAYVKIDNGTWVGGSITLTKPGVEDVFGGTACSVAPDGVGEEDYASVVCPYYVGGSITVQKGPAGMGEVSLGECDSVGSDIRPDVPEDMSVGGSVYIEHNRLFVEIKYSGLSGSLICLDNNPTAAQFDVTTVGANIGCSEDE